MSYDLKIISGDLVIKDGDLKIVTGTEKLVQDLLKILLTPVGANPSFSWYGSYVSKNLIGMTIDPDLVQAHGESQVRSALTNLMNLQKLQANSFQRVDPSEHIAGISNLSIKQNDINPTLYEVTVKVLTKALTQVETNFAVSPL